VFRTGRVTTRAGAELVPDRRFSYELVSGLAIRDYRADVDRTPRRRHDDPLALVVPPQGAGQRLAVTWSLSRFIERCALGLATAAVRQKITEG